MIKIDGLRSQVRRNRGARTDVVSSATAAPVEALFKSAPTAGHAMNVHMPTWGVHDEFSVQQYRDCD